MKAAELKTKTPEQLREELVGLKKEQFNLRFQASAGELTNSSRFRQIRRSIARIHTVMNANTSPPKGGVSKGGA